MLVMYFLPIIFQRRFNVLKVILLYFSCAMYLLQELADHQKLSETKIKELETRLLDQETQVIHDTESQLHIEGFKGLFSLCEKFRKLI